MEIFGMNHDVIAVFMNTHNINAHIAVRASSVQLSQKLQIIIVCGVFIVIVVICGGYVEMCLVLFSVPKSHKWSVLVKMKSSPLSQFLSFLLELSFGPLWIPTVHSLCHPLTLITVICLLRVFADLSDLFTSQIQSHGEMWITSVSLGQLAGHTWIHCPPSLPVIYILILLEHD